MLLAVITLALIAIALGFFVYGAIGLSKYAFRLGTGPGLLCLLFPPYTFYFAFFKLEEEGKDFPTAAWLFGILTTALLVGVFWSPLSKVVSGDLESLEAGGAGSAVEEYSSSSNSSDEGGDESATEEESAQQEPEDDEGAAADDEQSAESQDSTEGEEASDGESAEEDADGDGDAKEEEESADKGS